MPMTMGLKRMYLENHTVARTPSLKKSDQREGGPFRYLQLEVPPKLCYTRVRSLEFLPHWGTLSICLASSP